MGHLRGSFKKLDIYLGIMPGLIVYLLFALVPSLLTAFYSLTDISGIPGAAWHFIGLDNYKEFLFGQNRRDLMDAVKNTIVFSIAVTLIQNIVALFFAVVLNNRLRGRNFFKAMIFLPSVLGVTITGLCWTFMLNPLDGPVQKILQVFGMSSNFYSSYDSAFKYVMFTQIWMCMGVSLIIFIAGLQSIPSELYEAGMIDGTTPWKKFVYITLPMLWSTVTVNILYAVIGSLMAFQTIYVTTQGEVNTTTLAYMVFKQAFGIASHASAGRAEMRQGYASALTMLLFIIVLIATVFSQYIMNRKEKNA